MEREANKLFKFATKELSQDAFICWCINWFNYKEKVKSDKKKEQLVKMSEKILDKILENTDINSFHIKEVRIIRQFENIDITLVITTKSSKQYIVIIEDKVGANLSSKQKRDLYVSDLIKALENNEDKQELLGITEFNKDNIVPVFWKTSVWNENKEELQKELSKYIGKKVICINGNDTLEILKEYIDYSEIIEDFYTCLQDYLRINNQLPDDEHCVNKIKENGKLIEGTTFSKNYYVYNCFSKLTGKEYNKKSHPQTGGIILDKLSKRIIKEKVLNNSNKLEKRNNNKNIVAVDTIRFFKFKTSYKNKLSEDNKKWYEQVEQKNVDRGEFYTNLRYIFLFARKLNVFRKEQYEFLGLYKLIRYDENSNTRLWEKQNLPNKTVFLNEDEIINVIRSIENK
jgi:hypothetical protein